MDSVEANAGHKRHGNDETSSPLKKLKTEDETEKNVEEFFDAGEVPPGDMVAVLRDYCIQKDQPLPKFELFQTKAATYSARCQIASIRCIVTSNKQEAAKQKAAYQMFTLIRDKTVDLQQELAAVSNNAAIETSESQRYNLFKNYRELVGDTTKNRTETSYGISLKERHNYFVRFHKALKEAAKNVLNTSYNSIKQQVADVLSALKLNMTVDASDSINGKPMLFIELDCERFDVCFIGFEDKIYHEIIDYFRVMLQ